MSSGGTINAMSFTRARLRSAAWTQFTRTNVRTGDLTIPHLVFGSDDDIPFGVAIDESGGVATDVGQCGEEVPEQDLVEIVMLFSVLPSFDPYVVVILVHSDEFRRDTAIRLTCSFDNRSEITFKGSRVAIFNLKEAQVDEHSAPASLANDVQVTWSELNDIGSADEFMVGIVQRQRENG
jgi:hypothetical protein